MRKSIYLSLIIFLWPFFLFAQSIKSPNAEIKLDFEVKEGKAIYQLSYKGKTVIKPSQLGFELKNQVTLLDGFSLVDSKTDFFDEYWAPIWGEESQIRNHYNELYVLLS